MINNLNSIKLLAVSEAFDAYPNQRVDCDQFVKIMKQVLEDSRLIKRDDFVHNLVDLFYRANKSHGLTI